jgi:hypothetical protein
MMNGLGNFKPLTTTSSVGAPLCGIGILRDQSRGVRRNDL